MHSYGKHISGVEHLSISQGDPDMDWTQLYKAIAMWIISMVTIRR